MTTQTQEWDTKSLGAVMRAIFNAHPVTHEQLVELRDKAQKAYNQGGVSYVGSPAMALYEWLKPHPLPLPTSGEGSEDRIAAALALSTGELNKLARQYERREYPRGNARSRH